MSASSSGKESPVQPGRGGGTVGLQHYLSQLFALFACSIRTQPPRYSSSQYLSSKLFPTIAKDILPVNLFVLLPKTRTRISSRFNVSLVIDCELRERPTTCMPLLQEGVVRYKVDIYKRKSSFLLFTSSVKQRKIFIHCDDIYVQVIDSSVHHLAN